MREGVGGQWWEIIFSGTFGLQPRPKWPQQHTQNSKRGNTQQEWAAGDYRRNWVVWGARETRRYKWHPALLLLSRKGISLWMSKAFLAFWSKKVWRRDNIAVLLITETCTDFPSKSDSPVIAVWSLADEWSTLVSNAPFSCCSGHSGQRNGLQSTCLPQQLSSGTGRENI